jgi:hypothetical protein
MERVTKTLAQLDARIERMSLRYEGLSNELQQLRELPADDPRRIAGVTEVRENELEENRRIVEGLTDIRAEISRAVTHSEGFMQRIAVIRREQGEPLSPESLSEISANHEALNLVLQEANAKVDITAVDQGLQRFEQVHQLELERRMEFSERITALDNGLGDLRTAQRENSSLAQVAISEAIKETREIEADTRQFSFVPLMSWVTGTTAAREHSRDNMLRKAEEHNRVSETLLERYKGLKADRETFIREQQEGFRLEGEGKLDQAQARFNAAYSTLSRAAASSDQASLASVMEQPGRVWSAYNTETSRMLGDAIQSANSWESGLKTARTVTVVAGATVATIATAGAATPALAAAGASGWTIAGVSVATGTVGGTAGGMAVGTLANATEKLEAVRLGTRTQEEAAAEFSDQLGQDLKTSASTAFTSSLGIAGSARYLSHVTGNGNLVATTFQRTAAGAVGGGVSSTSNTAISSVEKIIARNETIAAFEADPANAHLSPEERTAALNSILEQQGLGYDQMTRAGAFNITAGILSGGTNARIQGLRAAATTTTARVVTGIAEPAADVGIGLTTSYLSNGTLSLEEAIVQTVQSGLIGSAIEHAPRGTAASGTRTGSAELSPSLRNTHDTPATGPSLNRHGLVYHENLESVRTSFVQDSIKQIQANEGRSPTLAEVRAIEEQASTMRAYQNSSNGEIHALRIEQSASRLQRVVAASDIVHELAHRRNGDEFAAHKAQIEFLEKNGYQVDLVEGAMKISPAGPGGPRTPSDADIREYIEAAYALQQEPQMLQRSAGRRNLDELGAEIRRTAQALPDEALRASVAHLLEEGKFKDALALVSAREDAEVKKLSDANFELAETLIRLREALEVHPDSFHSVRPAPVKVADSHLTNATKEISDYLNLFNYKPNLKGKVAQFIQDLSEVGSVEELQALTPGGKGDPTSIRSLYNIERRFHRYGSPVGPREVWDLEVDGGGRTIVGFDRSTHKHKILYTDTVNVHKNESEYKPEVLAAMANFLSGE